VLRDYLDYRRIAKLHSLSSDRVWIEQVHGLRALMKRLFDVPFYGDRLRKAGTKPGDLRTVKDLAMMPATTAEQFAQELRRRGDDLEAATASGGGTRALNVSFDANGRTLPHALGADPRARRLHLFAALGAWGAGSRSIVEIRSEGFGEEFFHRASLFRARHIRAVGERNRPFAQIIDPGSYEWFVDPESIVRGRPHVPGATIVLAGAPVAGVPARAILGNAIYGPIAWQCTAGAFHPIAGRAVIEAVTAEGAARGLTGGSRASRAPREAGALHLTLIESSDLPVFRVEMGLRGRIHPADCLCGARTNRLEMETPFLGPLVVPHARAGARTRALDPLLMLRDVGFFAHRVALIQDTPTRIRILASGTERGLRCVPAVAKHDDFAPPNIEVVVETGEESKLPFPERGFVQALGVEPILSIGPSSD
jgi:hypothetical protein